MKICLVQLNSIKGDITKNIEKHLVFVELAVTNSVDLIVFPELSITGYEPELASDLAINKTDYRFEVFQEISNTEQVSIAIGVPIKSKDGVEISILVFEPNNSRLKYSKQFLHEDEEPYFVQANNQMILNIKNNQLAPAICYESLQEEHLVASVRNGANIYMASVSKAQNGVLSAYSHFSKVTKKYSIPIVMVNSVGYCDNFESAGQSGYWNEKGELIGQLNETGEGILIIDTSIQQVVIEQYI